MRGDRLRLPRHMEFLQLRGARLHDFPIRFASHQDPDERPRFVYCHKSRPKFYTGAEESVELCLGTIHSRSTGSLAGRISAEGFQACLFARGPFDLRTLKYEFWSP